MHSNNNKQRSSLLKGVPSIGAAVPVHIPYGIEQARQLPSPPLSCPGHSPDRGSRPTLPLCSPPWRIPVGYDPPPNAYMYVL